MVERARPEGAFDRSLSPQVDIDEVDSQGVPGRHVATFATSTGPHSERIKVTGNHFQVNWKTRSYRLERGKVYRIKVTVSGREMGVADVRIAERQGTDDDDGGRCEIRTGGRSEFVDLQGDRTLPIKFFLNRCAPVVCAASDACHEAGTCDPVTAICSNPAKAEGASCSDGNACTRHDACVGGACVGSDPVVCAASDQCHEAGVCDPSSGSCSNPARADGSSCSDGNACTQTDQCVGGTCSGTTPVVCSAPGCTTPGTCNPANGTCSSASGCGPVCGNGSIDSQPPSSIQFVYLARRCQFSAGVSFRINGQIVFQGPAQSSCSNCLPGVRTTTLTVPSVLALVQPGLNVFSVSYPDALAWAIVRVVGATTREIVIFDAEGGGDAETRNPDLCAAGFEIAGVESGERRHSVEASVGEECDDGNTVAGDGCSPTCEREKCFGVVCAPKDGCHQPGVCEPSTGLCSNPPAPDETICDDGRTCTGQDICLLGTCTGVVSAACFANLVAPIDPSRSSNLADTTVFLYSGASPVQTDVEAGFLDPVRAAVVRGRVLGPQGNPLGAAIVTIVDHPEFGKTRSREDGQYDLAVNGGGSLQVQIQRPGYLPMDRLVEVPWADYALVPDVVMTPLDTEVTTVDLPADQIQVARGAVVTDEDGTRQATLFFMPGTTAMMDGRGLARLSVRATEYTVGAAGPDRMPATLPNSSGYGYAVELSVDEAIAAGALEVQFSRPVYFYLENLLRMPTGATVPNGHYDRFAHSWCPSDNGRVIRILDVSGGLAILDVDGSGLPASPQALAELQISPEEQAEVARLYTAGQTLWRVPLGHFSTRDLGNPPFGVPKGFRIPELEELLSEDLKDTSCKEQGSIIECQSQVLGQEIPITGTAYRLTYRSRLVPGDTRDYSLSQQVKPFDASVFPAKAITVETTVAGRTLIKNYTWSSYPHANPVFDFHWDGLDPYGRRVQGAHKATVRVGYTYPIFYRTPADIDRTFAAFSDGTQDVTLNRAAAQITFYGRPPTGAGEAGRPGLHLGRMWAPAEDLGGWGLDLHHRYDPSARVLHFGDGERQTAQDIKEVISIVAGSEQPTGRLTGPAREVEIRNVVDLAVSPSGEVYFADGSSIRRLTRAGDVQFVVSTQSPARALTFGPDGTLYFVVPNNGRLHYLRPGWASDAIAASGLAQPFGLAVAKDGRVFVAELFSNRVRTVDIGCGVNRVCIGTVVGDSPDGTPAPQVRLDRPGDLAVGPDDVLYIIDSVYRIRRVGADGVLYNIAGTGSPGFSPDGTVAKDAPIGCTQRCGLTVGADGTIYFLEGNRLRKIAPDGRLWTVAGTGQTGTIQDKASALGNALRSPQDVALLPDGRLVFADASITFGFLRRIEPPMPGFEAREIAVAGRDRHELYVFDPSGRHLRTQDILTGTVHHQFQYDGAGRLIHIKDAAGLTTTIERDGRGRATGILAPGGQRSRLEFDDGGYLATIANPAGEAHRFVYDSAGLMRSARDPIGYEHTFEYDTSGRLIKDNDPAGGSRLLARTGAARDFAVTTTTGLGRTNRYESRTLQTGVQRLRTIDPSGWTTLVETQPDGRRSYVGSDGTRSESTWAPDPRFGYQAPFPGTYTVTTPNGRALSVLASRSVLTDPGNSSVLIRQVDTFNVNGYTGSETYDVSTRLLTALSPMGRRLEVQYDAQGNVTRFQSGDLAPILLQFDTRGRLASTTAGTGTGARTWVTEYDGQDRPARLTDGLQNPTELSYDTSDRIISVGHPGGGAIAIGYDPNGNVTAITPPGRSAYGFGYSPIDLGLSFTLPTVAGSASTFSYPRDIDRKVDLVGSPGGASFDLQHDAGGRLVGVTTPERSTSLTYDATTGTIASVVTSDGDATHYGWDGFLPTEEVMTGTLNASLAWTYRNDFRVASYAVNGHATSYAYDADGLVTGLGPLSITRDPSSGLPRTIQTGTLSESYTLSGFGEVDQFVASRSGSTLYQLNLRRDLLGRIEEKAETIEGVTTTWHYSYDPAGRLWQVMRDGALTAVYQYDPNGNRIAGPGLTTAPSHDAQDRLLSYGQWIFDHGDHGLARRTDLTTGAQTLYSYDSTGNLRSVTLPDSTRIDYAVDARNRRIGKKVNGIFVRRWVYQDDLDIAAELDGAGGVISTFVSRAYFQRGGRTYRYIRDQLGSVRLVVDVDTGAVAQRIDYDEFGRVLLDTNPGFQPYGFAGGLYDPDTRLVRFGARDYDPQVGRWTARDPKGFVGGYSNLYAYVNNDPINLLDPHGLDWLLTTLDFLTGVADSLSMGLGPVAREVWDEVTGDDLAGSVDTCSSAYQMGKDAAFYFGLGRTAYAGAALGAGKAIARFVQDPMKAAALAVSARNAAKIVGRGPLSIIPQVRNFRRYTVEQMLAKKGGDPQKVLESAMKTNPGLNAAGLNGLIGNATSGCDKCP